MIPLALAAMLDISGSVVTLRDTTMPGAIAEIDMLNNPKNSEADDGAYALTLRDLEVWLTFRWNSGPAGADSIHVEPPDGIICRPSSCVLELQENSAGTLYLMEWEGM